MISRECYECASQHSFKDCDANRRRVRCLTSQRCVKASIYRTSGIRDEGYIRACAKTCSASDVALCSHPDYKCEVSCCSSDYCNGASGPVVNGILLIVTFTVSFLCICLDVNENTNRPNFVKITTLST